MSVSRRLMALDMELAIPLMAVDATLLITPDMAPTLAANPFEKALPMLEPPFEPTPLAFLVAESSPDVSLSAKPFMDGMMVT